MLKEDSLRTTTLTAGGSARSRVSHTKRQQRIKFRFAIAGLVIVATIGYMIFSAIQSGSEYFVTTSELKAMGDKAIGQSTKLGGRVVDGSIQWDKGANTLSFSLTDDTQNLPIFYKGVVPDSFQAGTDVILEGQLGADGTFQATSLMAKCASKYQPAAK